MRQTDKVVFRAIVVDDEPLARSLLITSLQAHPEIEVVQECKNGREAIDAVKALSPDLMFLDIEMPGLNGFDVIRGLNPESIPETIFVTAFNEFAIDAFDANAIDYLLKPVSEDRLARAINRVLIHLGHKEAGANKKRNIYGAMNKIAERVKKKQVNKIASVGELAVERKLSIKDGDAVIIVDESDIDWIDAAGDYMCIHVKGNTHVMRSTMHELISKLDEETFKRVHRSTVVNIKRIIKIQKHTKGEYILHLDCDETIKVSRHYKGIIRDFIEQQL